MAVPTRPPRPLRPQPLTPRQERQLMNDIRTALHMAEWPCCCRLCGWPVYRRGRTGRMQRHDDPKYGALCRLCAGALADDPAALHALDRIRAGALREGAAE